MNFWILQASPRDFLIDYFLEDYVKENTEFVDWWVVHKNHAGDFGEKDVVFIWKAKCEPRRPDYYEWKTRTGVARGRAGVCAVGSVVSVASRWPPTAEELKRDKKYRVGDPWSRFTESAPNIVRFKYDDNLVYRRRVLDQEQLWSHPDLSSNDTDLAKFKRNRRGRRSVKLTPQEAGVIWMLIYGSPFGNLHSHSGNK